MKAQTRKFSWFQILILVYIIFIFFLTSSRFIGINTISVLSSLVSTFFIFILMSLFNKYLAPKIHVNENLKKSWRIIKIIIVCLIILWFISLFIAALYGFFIKK